MRSHRRTLLTVLVSLGICASLSACLADTSVIDARLTAAVQPKPAPATGCVEACGISLRVTTRQLDGTDVLEYDKNFGTYKGTETPAMASASKWFSSAVVMSVVDEGKLSLDDTVGEFFPAYAGTQKGSITFAQLFSHTSGISGLNLAQDPCVAQADASMAACAESILARPLLNAPGTAFAYGSMSMQVAGRMAEIATGTPFLTLVQTRLFTPLGMTHSRWIGTTNPRVDGGAVSSVADMDRFLAMIQGNGTVGGVRVLSRTAVRDMETDRTQGLARAYTPAPEMDGYGIGVWVTDVPGGIIVASPGMFGEYPMINRARCYRSVLQQSASSGVNARNQMATIRPELDRQLSC